MKINTSVLTAVITSSIALTCAPKGHASPYESRIAGPTVELNQCQKKFGKSGNKNYVFGYLPLKGDYFYGEVTIGSAQQKDEYEVETLFKGGSFHYHQAIPYKNMDLTLDTNPDSVPASGCVDCENTFGRAAEVVQFNWKGSDTVVASTSWALWYKSFDSFDCYLGADNGSANIVLMCKLSDFFTAEELYGYDIVIYDQIRSLTDIAGFVAEVCDSLGEKAERGKPELCRDNFQAIHQGMYPLFTNVTAH